MPRKKIVGYQIGNDRMLCLCRECAKKLLSSRFLKGLPDRWKFFAGYEDEPDRQKVKDELKEKEGFDWDGTVTCQRCCETVRKPGLKDPSFWDRFIESNPSGLHEFSDEEWEAYFGGIRVP